MFISYLNVIHNKYDKCIIGYIIIIYYYITINILLY